MQGTAYPWAVDSRGWWLCDICGEPIKPRPAVPTPELPIVQGECILWGHRTCIKTLQLERNDTP